MAIPIAFVVYRWFDEPTTTTPAADDNDSQSYLRRLFLLSVRPRVLVLLVDYAGPTFLYFGFQAYVSVAIVQALDGTPRDAAAVVALFSVMYALAATQSGRIAELFADRYRPLVGSNTVMTAGLAGFAFAPSVPAAILGSVLFGVGYGLTSSLYRSVLPELAPGTLRGGLVILSDVTTQIAMFPNPSVSWTASLERDDIVTALRPTV